ncbi:uncharacterized protein [Macrobrachium rosenbergii]|uniref:uncharacterized protein n=1 Tax=Macrobrachium rosenbergii TaxID=79674 RepID=UPI0034D4382E
MDLKRGLKAPREISEIGGANLYNREASPFCYGLEGWFGYHGVSSPIVLPPKETVTKESYLLLNEHLEEAFEKTKTEIFQHLQVSEGWLSDCGINFMEDWPGKSPDLNPIENLWAMLKQKIKSVDTSTIELLTAALHTTWEEVAADRLQNLADSIPERLKR